MLGQSPRGGAVQVAELGVVTRAVLEIARDVGDDRALAEQVCQAYMGAWTLTARRSRC